MDTRHQIYLKIGHPNIVHPTPPLPPLPPLARSSSRRLNVFEVRHVCPASGVDFVALCGGCGCRISLAYTERKMAAAAVDREGEGGLDMTDSFFNLHGI